MGVTKINFTKVAIDALPVSEPGKRRFYHDSRVLGLQLRVTSVRTFFVDRRVKGGNPERITLGRYPHMTIEQARHKAIEILHEIKKGQAFLLYPVSTSWTN